MAGSKNAVSLIGRLGADPEIKNFDNGGSILNLRLATSETWKDKNGERQERTEWHQVVIKNENLAKIGDRYLNKGDRVGIEGKIQTRKYKDKDDNERYVVEIVVGPFGGELILLENPRNNDNDNDRGGGRDDRGGRNDSRGRDDRGGRDDNRSRSSRDDSRGGDGGGRGRGRDDERGSRDDGRSSNSRGGNSNSRSNDRNDMDDDIPF